MKYKVELSELTDMTEEERKEVCGKIVKKASSKYLTGTWFTISEYNEWDRKLFRDYRLGKLDGLLERGRKEYANGNTVPMKEFLNTKEE